MLKKLYIYIDSLIVSVLVILVIYLFSTFSINIDLLDPFETAFSDFEFTDLYFSNFRAKEKVKVDTNIVIVNIGRLDRDGINNLLNSIYNLSPKVIGVDILFPKDESENNEIFNTIYNNNKIVNVFDFNTLGKEENFFQYPIDSSISTFGYSNFIEDGTFRTVRKFAPMMKFKEKNYYHFCLEIIKKYNPDTFENFVNETPPESQINYKGNFEKFITINHDAITGGKVVPSLLKDKIVLVGYLGDYLSTSSNYLEDKFFSPLNKNFIGRSLPDIAGIVIQANIIAMILEKNYLFQTNDLAMYLLYFLVFFINSLFFARIFRKYYKLYSALSKVIIIFESIIIFIAIFILLEYSQIKLPIKFLLVGLIVLPDFWEVYIELIHKLRSRT